MAQAAPVRRDRPRRDAARARRLRDLPAAARRRRLGAGPDADRARRGRGPRRRPRRGRRRLPDKPFSFAELLARLRALVRRGGGRAADRARGRRPPPRPARGGSGAARREISLSPKEFALLETFMRRPGRGAVAAPAARARLGLRLREPLERRRRLRPLPAREDRPAVRHASRSRPCAAPATGCARTRRREPAADPSCG